MNIIILGPQGSGKGTQAKYLSEELNLPRLSLGQLYREQIKKSTDLGKKAEEYVLKGELVPLKITKDLLINELNNAKYKKGLILDGFPRNMEQYKLLKKIMTVDYVILIEIPKQETIKRLSGRRICSVCGENYNVHFDNIKDMKCKCGGKLIRRKDDYPKAIKERLQTYKEETLPIVDEFTKSGKLIKINGKAPIKKVNNRILTELQKRGIN